jgi:hypothetical protein
MALAAASVFAVNCGSPTIMFAVSLQAEDDHPCGDFSRAWCLDLAGSEAAFRTRLAATLSGRLRRQRARRTLGAGRTRRGRSASLASRPLTSATSTLTTIAEILGSLAVESVENRVQTASTGFS